MNISWFIRDVCEGIRGAPLRTVLITFSMGTGVLSLTILLSILGGLKERTEQLKREIGAEEIWVGGTLNGKPFLDESDVKRLSGIFPSAFITGVRVGNTHEGPEGTLLKLFGGNADMARIRGWKLKDGRFLDPMDSEWDASVAVLGSDTAEKLSLRPGDKLVLERESLTVIGVVHGNLNMPGGIGDGLDSLLTAKNNPILQKNSQQRYDGILLHTPQGSVPELAVSRLQQDWCRNWPQAKWNILTAERLLRSTRMLSRTVGWVYGSVAGLCLVLGGVTLGSLMALAVRQRQREIGLRLAVGASPADIFSLFLAEGLCLSGFSSGMGVFVAGGLLRLRWAPEHFPMSWSPFSWMISSAVAISMGFLFSLWPALLAVRIAPAEAMRTE